MTTPQRVTDAANELRRDGGPVRIRMIAADDLAAVRDLHLGASDRSNYFRFFGGGRQGAIAYLPTLVAPASDAHHALLAEIDGDVVAVASFEGTGGGVAEVSLLVADDWQHDGIGTLLMEHLVTAARRVGVHRFVAETMTANVAITEVLRDLGYALAKDRDHGTTTTTFDITLSVAAVDATERRAVAARTSHALRHGCVEGGTA